MASSLVRHVLSLVAFSVVCGAGDRFVNAQLPWHQASVDSQGRLLAWYAPERNLGYDHVLRLGWDFIEHRVPKDTVGKTGRKVYLVNSVYQPETLQGVYYQHNPAMVYASFVDSVVAWYPYSGDQEAIGVVREMLDYQLAHGTTPSDWEWPGVPYATGCGNRPEYGQCLAGMPGEFQGGIETDKVGELGTGYALFYQLTGEKRFLEAAIRCGNALARHVNAGDEDHTPWPFRLDARGGATLASMEYGGNVVASVRLFDELVKLKAGNTALYQKARETAWNWIKRQPLNRESRAWDKWAGYFEDVGQGVENLNQMSPLMTAHYILSQDDPATVAPNWTNHAGHLIDWVRQRFGRGPFLGAWGIDEQGTPDGRGCCSRAGLSSHTARWAAVNAMYFERTGDAQAREDAFRSLNYATYFITSDGQTSCCGKGFRNPFWFSDGYSDYLRHINWVMGAIPELAPLGQDHLLRSSSVVRKVQYSKLSLRYSTFADSSMEVLRLSYAPSSVRAGNAPLEKRKDLSGEGYTLDALAGGDFILRIRHTRSGDVSITGLP
jgi:hypothetical protein